MPLLDNCLKGQFRTARMEIHPVYVLQQTSNKQEYFIFSIKTQYRKATTLFGLQPSSISQVFMYATTILNCTFWLKYCLLEVDVAGQHKKKKLVSCTGQYIQPNMMQFAFHGIRVLTEQWSPDGKRPSSTGMVTEIAEP